PLNEADLQRLLGGRRVLPNIDAVRPHPPDAGAGLAGPGRMREVHGVSFSQVIVDLAPPARHASCVFSPRRKEPWRERSGKAASASVWSTSRSACTRRRRGTRSTSSCWTGELSRPSTTNG